MSRRLRLIRLVPQFALGLPAALAILAAACTAPEDGSGLPVKPSTAPTLEGWILSSGHVPGQGLLATRLPDGQSHPMGLSIKTAVFDARWVDPGKTAYAFVQPGDDQTEVQLISVGTDGLGTPVGDVLENVNATAAAGGTFLAATCDHGRGDVQIVRTGEAAWRHVAEACTATLSPDGNEVAFAQDGHTVQSVPIAGGEPATLFDLADVDALGPAGLAGAKAGEMAWGPGGLAMVLRRGDRFGVLVHTPDGDRFGAIPGAPAFVGLLRWQPDGTLVTMQTFFQGQGSVLRAMDARDGRITVLATDPRGLGGTVWSPDGSLLASLDSRGAWVFVDRNGNRTNEVPVDNEFPFDWGS